MSKKNKVTFQRLPGQKTLATSSSIRQRERDRAKAENARLNLEAAEQGGSRHSYLDESTGKLVDVVVNGRGFGWTTNQGGAFLQHSANVPPPGYQVCPSCMAELRPHGKHTCVDAKPMSPDPYVSDETKHRLAHDALVARLAERDAAWKARKRKG